MITDFFRRTEVIVVYILLIFGAVFAYLWYLQLSAAPVSSALLELVYASLAIFWGGLFLGVTTLHASAANDDYRQAILDLVWRKQEMVVTANAAAAPPLPLHGTVSGSKAGKEQGGKAVNVVESSLAIDAAIGICRWGHETEGLSVFGVRLGHQVLTSVAVITAGQIVLFSQLVLRHYGLAGA